jgi:protein-serine/threonine kinase
MSNHNREEEEDETEVVGSGKKLTALNDENTYKFEQARYKRELDDFYWSREEHEWDLVEEVHGDEVEDEGSVVELPEEISSTGSSISGGQVLSEVSLEGTAFIEDINDVSEEPAMGTKERIEIEGVEIEGMKEILGTQAMEEAAIQQVVESAILPISNTTPVLSPTKLSGAMSSMQLSSPEHIITPDTSSGDIPVQIKDDSEVSPAKSQTNPSPTKSHSPNPLSLPNIQPISPTLPTSSDLPLSSRPVIATKKPIPVPPIRPRPGGPTRIHSGLPASGLSSSDVIVVSLPSPGIDGPRLIRRHPQITSIDSIPASRLSIDLHGAITQLGEDDWEALEAEGSVREFPSAPNGNGKNVLPSSFFNRLKRRPSNIISSGLRRATNPRSNGSSSRESSPTKINAMFGGTKKVIGKLKAFPMLRSRRTSNQSAEVGGDGHPSSPTSQINGSTPRRPGPGRRHTESGWFERKISKGKYGKERSLTPSSEGTSISAEPSIRKGKNWESKSVSEGNLFRKSDTREGPGEIGGPPRIELNEMGSPVDWALGPEVSAGLAWAKKHDESG